MSGAQPAVVFQAYEFALDLTPRQQGGAASHVGAHRFAFNWGLALVKDRLDRQRAGEDVRVPWSLFELRREWNQAKGEVAPWWRENSKEAYSSGLDALARGLSNWLASKQGRRNGARVGFPKRKGHGRQACRFTTGAIRVEPDRHHVTLPRLGRLRTHESTRKLARRVEQGTARVLSATLSRRGDRWYMSFACEVHKAVRSSRPPQARIGVDVGIRHLAVLSDGHRIPNPAPLQAALRELRLLNRQLARRTGPITPDGTRREPSNGWLEAKRRLGRAHAKVADIRRDALHHLTSTLAATYQTVVMERLNVAGMLKNRRLARRLADAGLGELRRQLGCKTAWVGGTLVLADTFFPSSKTCSGCGHVKAKLSLSERTYRCERCGLVLDRDENAARNLAALFQTGGEMEMVAGSGPETRNARGADVRPGLAGQTAMNREAGTGRRPGETGTVGAQAPAARIAETPMIWATEPGVAVAAAPRPGQTAPGPATGRGGDGSPKG
jgi:transposase